MRRRDFCLALAGALLLPRNASAQEDAGGFEPFVYKDKRGQEMPYRLYTPRGKAGRYPLVVWLHGGAGRGNDNLRQITGGNTLGARVWTTTENQSRFPCYVVAPQCAENQMWATLDRAEPTGQLLLALDLIGDLRKRFRLDKRRIYLAGQSLGGFGVWGLITARPRAFAAALPICGGGDKSKGRDLVAENIWAFHGERDMAVSVERSRSMIESIRKAGGSPRYTEYKGEGHTIWEKVFREPELLPWVFAQRA